MTNCWLIKDPAINLTKNVFFLHYDQLHSLTQDPLQMLT